MHGQNHIKFLACLSRLKVLAAMPLDNEMKGTVHRAKSLYYHLPW